MTRPTKAAGESGFRLRRRSWRAEIQTIASNVSSAGHMYLVYAAGTLAVSGDDKVVYTSTDGVTWAKKDGLVGAGVCGGTIKSADACKAGADDKWEGPTSWVRSRWMGKVDASTDQGTSWGPTFQDPDMNHYTAFGFGFSPM